ncbi:MAG TPA: hypothetical protein VD815_03605 [Candidatus Saccharimonadales bacterium]|nr:hypothetical protein [Candidatus Saccharimonadales bacterium]
MIIDNKFIQLVTIISLTAAIVISPTITFAVPNNSNHPNATCLPTGKQTPNGGEEVECCWTVDVAPGTGVGGQSYELYCSECENGGTRGYINCSEPSLQYRDGKPLPPLSGNINDGEISDDPEAGDDPNPGIPPRGGVSDDPKAGDDPNPGIPPTGGVTDETENENADTPTNTIPRKGDSGLDTSTLNENVIVQ